MFYVWKISVEELVAYLVAVCGSYLFACGKTSNMQLAQNNLSLQAIWLEFNWIMTDPIYSVSRWLIFCWYNPSDANPIWCASYQHNVERRCETRLQVAFTVNFYLFSLYCSTAKRLIEQTRECHNHKPQPNLDTKRNSKRTKTSTCKINKQMCEKHTHQLPLPQARWLQCWNEQRNTRTKSTARL